MAWRSSIRTIQLRKFSFSCLGSTEPGVTCANAFKITTARVFLLAPPAYAGKYQLLYCPTDAQ
jgi:hypothetical protein